MGVEPTGDWKTCRPPVLKTVAVTGLHALPARADMVFKKRQVRMPGRVPLRDLLGDIPINQGPPVHPRRTRILIVNLRPRTLSSPFRCSFRPILLNGINHYSSPPLFPFARGSQKTIEPNVRPSLPPTEFEISVLIPCPRSCPPFGSGPGSQSTLASHPGV